MSNLEFFNSLSGKLEIELTEPAQQIGNLLNEFAPADARIVALKFHAEMFNQETGEFRELTDEELGLVAFSEPRIRLRGESGEEVVHEAPNGAHFTVQDLILAVEKTERETRDQSEWFGGVDVQHCYFEGLHSDDDEVFDIYWGS